mmetsp:Transcript_88806/g.248548  ORF Transcript_88806/g.248548 Transcript_88806/m.248548 type:complete len:275 (+) Transcript_88806:247-1071(+)
MLEPGLASANRMGAQLGSVCVCEHCSQLLSPTLLGLGADRRVPASPHAPCRAVVQFDRVLSLDGRGHNGCRRRQRQRVLASAQGREVDGEPDVEVSTLPTIADQTLLLEPHDLVCGRDLVKGHRDLLVAEVWPGVGEAEDRLLQGDAQHRVQVGLGNGIGVDGAASLHLEDNLARKLARGLVANVRDMLQHGVLFCAFGNPEIGDGDADLPATLPALLLLLAHAHDLLAEGRHPVLRHLDLLRRASPTLSAPGSLRIRPATPANDEPAELVRLL